MLERARLRPGMRVLDVGTGPGDTAILAAQRVEPDGSVLGIDTSPQMIEQASGKLAGRAGGNIEFRLMDGSALAIEDESVDAVISRNAVQFLPGWPSPLRGFLRVLRRGGWLSFLVWDVRQLNPFFSLPAMTAIDLDLLRVPVDALRLPYGLSRAPLEQQLMDAGFREVEVEHVRGEVRTEDLQPLVNYATNSPGYQAISSELNADEKARYQAAVVAGIERFRDGSAYRVESVSRVASAMR